MFENFKTDHLYVTNVLLTTSASSFRQDPPEKQSSVHTVITGSVSRKLSIKRVWFPEFAELLDWFHGLDPGDPVWFLALAGEGT